VRDDFNSLEKRKVLEAFVENDDALGLLLDFISSKHMHPSSTSSGATSSSSQIPDAASQGGLNSGTIRSF
jgi:hypothetical protein